MSKGNVGVFVLVLSLVAMMTSTAFAGGWEHVDTTDGVKVFERDLGDDLAFKGVMEADIHIGKLVSTFVDPSQRPHWVDRYGEHQTLERTRSAELYWLRFDMPFGVSDRDYVLRADYDFQDANKTFISNTRSIEDRRKPEDDCCVRAETTTKYTFTALDGEKTRIEVEVQSDIKGRIPGRIVNSLQREWPVTTLTNLVERSSRGGVEVDSRTTGWH